MSVFPRKKGKTQSSLNFLQSGPRTFSKSDSSGLAPIRRVLKIVSDAPHLGTFCHPLATPFLLLSPRISLRWPPQKLFNFSEGLQTWLPTGHPRDFAFGMFGPPPPPFSSAQSCRSLDTFTSASDLDPS